MRYFLKLADGDQYFEEVDKFTYDNYKFALSDGGNGPRYLFNNWAILNDGWLSLQLTDCPLRDVAILQRGLEAIAPAKVDGGFIREPQAIRFSKRNKVFLRLKNGEIFEKKAA